MPPAEQLYAEVLELRAKVTLQDAQIAWLKKQLFGPGKSETLDRAQLLLKLGELEKLAKATPPPVQTITYERAQGTKAPRAMPAEVFAHLPVKQTIEVVPEAVKNEPDLYEKIGEERTFEVDVVPGQLVAHQQHANTRIDNNLVENAIRPSAIGKKNWLFIGHPDAGQRSAIIYSLVVSCQRQGKDPFAYMMIRCRGKRGSVCCAYRAADRIHLVLDVFVRMKGETTRAFLRRVSRADWHHPLCIWRLPDTPEHPAETEETRPSAALFAPIGMAQSRNVWLPGDEDLERSRDRAIRFQRFASRALAGGMVAAWRHGIDRGIVRPERGPAPDAQLVARGIEWHMRRQQCVEGMSPFMLAEKCGLRLVHGICLDETPFDERIRPLYEDTPLRLYVFSRGAESAFLLAQSFKAPPLVVELAATNLKTIRSSVRPPYYVVAVAEPDGRLRRLALFPAHFDQRNLIFVDSGLERACAAEILAAGNMLLKPTERSVLDELALVHPSLAWLGGIPEGQLPDFILCEHQRRVIELAGFDRRFTDYHRNIAHKARTTRAQNLPYAHEVWDGRRFQHHPIPPLDWHDARLPIRHT